MKNFFLHTSCLCGNSETFLVSPYFPSSKNYCSLMCFLVFFSLRKTLFLDWKKKKYSLTWHYSFIYLFLVLNCRLFVQWPVNVMFVNINVREIYFIFNGFVCLVIFEAIVLSFKSQTITYYNKPWHKYLHPPHLHVYLMILEL